MKSVFRFTVVICAALLAGCSMTEGEFNNVQAVVSGSPSAKSEAIRDCIADERTEPLSKKKEIALVFNINMSNYEKVYCTRLWNAMARGRITYDDYLKLRQPNADSSKVIRIIQGR